MTGEPRFDVAVLGAGVIGVSTAIHLARRGVRVALVDRRAPGEETSYGNAGIIQREAIHPYVFPRDTLKLIQYALNRRADAHYQLSSLPAVASFLWRYFRASGKEGARRTMLANIPLFAACLDEHGAIAKEAGAEHLIARNGWICLLRSDPGRKVAEAEAIELVEVGIDAKLLAPAEISSLEPHLDVSPLVGGVHFRDPWTVSDPGALVKSYNGLFEKLGGSFHTCDVRSARRGDGGWRIGESLVADRIVVALGPWSKDFLAHLGLDLPMGIKRGYHRHYRPAGNAYLTRPVMDDDIGYVLAPMAQGIRLTSGAEFARLDAPKTPVQISRCLPYARQLFDLGEPVESEPWMGARPVFPDMLPVIGPAPGLPGVWLNFGHAHHGLTLGPAVGRLLAEMMTGETPFCDPQPYSAERFA